ncbi:MAG: hypothetical protein D6707_07535 [Bacteroidetes bacterium]|nr:MAG: hypothetical protein D6707_07535 [Bacteroidota bacterium]
MFEHFNQTTNCPICNTNKDGKAVLIPIEGTEDDGIMEAMQVHLDCIDLFAFEDDEEIFLVQKVKRLQDAN